ncbi:MAG: hypothetical protein P4K97_07030 [Terracidiphilus sp.]|nr:hypothetical protein [Terracidiphilus sp.]
MTDNSLRLLYGSRQWEATISAGSCQNLYIGLPVDSIYVLFFIKTANRMRKTYAQNDPDL